MDLGEILPSYFRYNLGTGPSDQVQVPPARRDFLFIDMVMGIKPTQKYVNAPQDLGEFKHGPFDQKPLEPLRLNPQAVASVEQSAFATTAKQAHHYRSFSRFSLLETRKTLENSVRKLKRQRLPCPFQANESQCTKVFIRCGERTQFSKRETVPQQRAEHRCKYMADSASSCALIVDTDERIREFCKQTLQLFFASAPTDIFTADNAPQAIELINRSKQSNQRFGLVIIDSALPANSGYWLVNEIFQRNHDCNIILTSDASPRRKPPGDYLGESEILPDDRFVNIVLTKPFHSDTLITAVKKLRLK
jgi:CheY-like chemotaxis protein